MGVHVSLIGIAQSFLRAHGHGCASVAEDQTCVEQTEADDS